MAGSTLTRRSKTPSHTWFSSATLRFIAPDLATLRELLLNANNEASLAGNAEFRKTIEQRGDVVYFSDFNA